MAYTARKAGSKDKEDFSAPIEFPESHTVKRQIWWNGKGEA